MKNLTKKVIGTLGGLSLLAGCSTIPENAPMPQSVKDSGQNEMPDLGEYENYKERFIFMVKSETSVRGNKYGLIGYEMGDGDMSYDVMELYPLPLRSPNPFVYVFDFNNNKNVDTEEILIDKRMDGINGNEIWMDDFLERMKDTENVA